MQMNHLTNPIGIDAFSTQLRSYGWSIGLRHAFNLSRGVSRLQKTLPEA
jgi:hypothetical protein